MVISLPLTLGCRYWACSAPGANAADTANNVRRRSLIFIFGSSRWFFELSTLQRFDVTLNSFTIYGVRDQFQVLLVFVNRFFTSAGFFVKHSQTAMRQRGRIIKFQGLQVQLF